MSMYSLGTFDWETHREVLFLSETALTKRALAKLAEEVLIAAMIAAAKEDYKRTEDFVEYKGVNYNVGATFFRGYRKKRTFVEAELERRGIR